MQAKIFESVPKTCEDVHEEGYVIEPVQATVSAEEM